MKHIIFIIAIFIPSISIANQGYTMVLENNNVLIIMDMQCSPFDIECKKIDYRLFNKKTSAKEKGAGSSINVGVNRNFRGYQLNNGSKIYSLYETSDDNMWDFITEEKSKQISSERVKTIFNDKAD